MAHVDPSKAGACQELQHRIGLLVDRLGYLDGELQGLGAELDFAVAGAPSGSDGLMIASCQQGREALERALEMARECLAATYDLDITVDDDEE